MDQVRLGATGLHVSRVCLGMMSYGNDSDRPWALDEEAAEPIIRRAVEAGITFFDTADVYSQGASEVATGRLVSKFLSRDEAVIATKVHGQMTPGPNGRGLSRKHVLAAIDASLERLGLDHVDLYQIHRWDPQTPIEETMEALHDIVRAGKARYIGASSMHAWQFAKAQHVAERHGWTRFVSMQNHVNLLYREEEREMIPQCIDQGVGVIPWSPLARGFLTGTRTREGERRTTRAETDAFQDSLYGRPEDFDVDRPPQRGGGRALRLPGAGGAGVAAAQAGHHRADRRRHQARAPRGGHRRSQPVAVEPGDRAPRGALRAPPGARARITAVEGSAPSPQKTWDALFSEFYLRAYADEEADADAGAQAARAARLAACPPGGDLLDVPCGYGRHSIPLARAGYRVTGVDSSPTLLAEARSRAGDPAPDLVEADYRELPFAEHSFDAALNLFTSLGFHGDDEDVKALADIGRVLRPTGRLVIETMHRDLAVRGFREQDWRLLGEGRLLLEQRTFDAAAGIAQTTQTLIDKDGGRDSRTFSVRLYTATELVAMLGRAGFADVRCYGDLDGGPFDTTTRLVIVARRS